MRKLFILISYIGLAFTIVPSFLVLKGIVELQQNFWLMGIGMILWFGSAPLWMKSKSLEETEE